MKDRNEIMRFFGLHPQNDVRRKFAFTLADGATHVDNFNNKRRFAFTLAEVLVTLGIIGVVAVLTVPNIISSYQKKVYVAQLQKAYNQISNAVALLMVDEEVDNLNDTYLYCDQDVDGEDVCLPRAGDFLKKYFKVSKDCGYGDDRYECINEVYKTLYGDNYYIYYNGMGLYCVNINNSASMCIRPFSNANPLLVAIDVNGGNKKPNTWGRDTFLFSVNYRGEIAENFAGYPNHLDPDLNPINNPNRCSETTEYAEGCFTKIINDGWKMDY